MAESRSVRVQSDCKGVTKRALRAATFELAASHDKAAMNLTGK
jgi:hypothetical protein